VLSAVFHHLLRRSQTFWLNRGTERINKATLLVPDPLLGRSQACRLLHQLQQLSNGIDVAVAGAIGGEAINLMKDLRTFCRWRLQIENALATLL
jgi:hypothetical protein